MEDDHTDEITAVDEPTGEDAATDSATDGSSQEETRPQHKPRRKRPNGRWSNPASPLQAARFELRLSGKDVAHAIRRICPGHGGEPCRIDVSKVSDYETGNRRPAVDHIEAFARLYVRSPEQLGLIKWRDQPTGDDATGTPDNPDTAPTHASDTDEPSRPQFILVWVRDHLDSDTTATATAILRLLSGAPGRDDPTGDKPAE